MARTGYLITVYKDINPSSSTYNYVREERTQDDETCGVVEPQYRWVAIEGSFVCSGYDKYSVEKYQVSYDGGTTWEDEGTTRTGSLIESNSEDCGYSPTPTPEPTDYSSQYFTIEAVKVGTLTIKATGSGVARKISYSLDNGSTWTSLTTSTTAQQLGGTLSPGDKVLVKGTNTNYASESNYNSFGGTAKVNIYGNIMSLIYGDDFENETELPSNGLTFIGLFYGHTGLMSAENLILPSTTLVEGCYTSMFRECTSLTTPPALPATTLARQCYQNMFRGCTSLTVAPALPATNMLYYCYSYMFQDCTSLTTAPELPATTLMDYCYDHMFTRCTSLNYIKAMFTTRPSSYYTREWVSSVSSTGTFVKNSAATWSVTGVESIPEGWTVIEE